MDIAPIAAPNPVLNFAWLEVTGRCQLECLHCYADSGPKGTHGTMTYLDWVSVVDQMADLGVSMVQMIGGEPTLWPGLPGVVGGALYRGLEVEVYTNLVHVTDAMWELFALPGVRLATSYYTDDAGEHQRITGRLTLDRTRANIRQALEMSIPLRVGVIDLGGGQRVEDACRELSQLGVTDMGLDRMRLLGRPARGVCDASELCGRCGDGIAAILPDGTVAPCPLARWLSAGNVQAAPLAELAPRVQAIAESQIRPARPHTGGPCEPSCTPGCDPSLTKPGGGDGCTPQKNCNPNQTPKEPCKPDVSCKPKR